MKKKKKRFLQVIVNQKEKQIKERVQNREAMHFSPKGSPLLSQRLCWRLLQCAIVPFCIGLYCTGLEDVSELFSANSFRGFRGVPNSKPPFFWLVSSLSVNHWLCCYTIRFSIKKKKESVLFPVQSVVQVNTSVAVLFKTVFT